MNYEGPVVLARLKPSQKRLVTLQHTDISVPQNADTESCSSEKTLWYVHEVARSWRGWLAMCVFGKGCDVALVWPTVDCDCGSLLQASDMMVRESKLVTQVSIYAVLQRCCVHVNVF